MIWIGVHFIHKFMAGKRREDDPSQEVADARANLAKGLQKLNIAK